ASKKERSTHIFFVGRLFARGKKSKEANRSTSTSEGEDEVLTALSMADDLGKKVDMILNKLQKLDNTELRLDNLHKSIASLEESFAFLEKDVQNLKDKTEKMRTKVDDLEKSVEFCEDMPKELYQLRKAQMKKLQNAKQNGSTAYFSRKYADKLFIDGNYIPRN
ncbi:unnamed protein product, partial [Porites lobata]